MAEYTGLVRSSNQTRPGGALPRRKPSRAVEFERWLRQTLPEDRAGYLINFFRRARLHAEQLAAFGWLDARRSARFTLPRRPQRPMRPAAVLSAHQAGVA